MEDGRIEERQNRLRSKDEPKTGESQQAAVPALLPDGKPGQRKAASYCD